MSIDWGMARNLFILVLTVLAAYGCTMIVRTLVAGIARWLGVFPPEWYSQFCLPWRPVAERWLQFSGWLAERHHGKKATADFAGPLAMMTMVYRRGMIYLGRNRLLQVSGLMPIGMEGRGAGVIIGQARSGKSAHIIVRATMWHGNLLAFDIDGTLTHVLARRLADGGGSIIGKGGKFCCLDFNGHMKGFLKSARWNIYEELDRSIKKDPDSAVRWADKITDALIIEDNQSQPFFAQSSKSFLRALILFVYVRRENKNLVEVRDLLTRGLWQEAGEGEDPHNLLFFEMQETPDFGGIIARGGALGQQGKTKDGRNITTGTALSQTSWLDDPSLAYIVSGSDFSVEELKTGDLSLTLVAPASDMKSRLSPIYRLLLTAALYTAEAIPGRGKRPVLYSLDEWCAIGQMSGIDLSYVPAVYPKYGVTALFAAQDVSQIESVYGKSWETFTNNSDSTTFLATESEATIDYLHRKLGTCTQRIKVAPETAGQKARVEHRERPVMMPDDIRRFLSPEKGNAIVIRTGKRPLKLKNGLYFRENSVWQVDPDPQYKEPFQRAWARKRVSAFLAWQQKRRERPPVSEALSSPKS